MSKISFLIFSTLISTLSIAGTHGGGVESVKAYNSIVYSMGEQDGLVKFAYAQLVNNEWQVQKLEMPETDLMADASVMKALQDSKDLKSWAEIK